MSNPCVFCGSGADKRLVVNPKIKSWVLRPSSLYPMCNDCMVLNENGDDNALVDLIQKKWKRIEESRNKLIKLPKMLLNEPNKVLQVGKHANS